jgi:hypothetical protein
MTSTMRFDKWENSLGQPYGTVLQVVSATKTNTFTMSSSTFSDVPDLSVTITPKFASSKILVTLSLSGSADEGTGGMFARLMRDSTAIGIGDSDGSRIRATIGNISTAAGIGSMSAFTFLDSPATTAAVVYKAQVANNGGGTTVFINRTPNNSDLVNFARTASSITLMEIAQ